MCDRYKLFRLTLLLLSVVLSAVQAQAQASGFSGLSALVERGFLVSAEARLLDNNEVLGAIEPKRQLSPASVSKAYVAAAALDRWGPQHRFDTRLVSEGNLDAHGRLHGDLVFDGSGDPALSSEDLWRLVQRLHQRGVREVDGRLVISQWRFGPVECITTDRCDAHSRVDNAYSALLSSAGINHGSWCVNVAPGAAAGEPARITNCDSHTPLIDINNQVVTRPDDSGTELHAERISRGAGDTMVVKGQMSLNALPRQLYRASSDPALQTATLLKAMLDEAGVAIKGEVVTSIAEPPPAAWRLAQVEGKPLQEVLLRTMNYSNNFMADMLALDLVRTPRATLDLGGAAIERFVAGIPGHGELTLRSGSGLTPDNRTSAHGINTLLESMYHRPSLFPSFVASFQSPGNGVMRFIRRGSYDFQHNVMLKTGTLNEPVAVRAIGGYFRTQRGRWGVFSVLVNGTSTTPWLNWTQVFDPLTEDLTRMITEH
ncbi:D-alanyl-D-alanine carboxypeptidase/D-alanyl-D-alanine endopeptidase [Halomonas korlensis]|uniref:D-alanyl-D-alanine carboxypeptidase / D-alanyl-D-alanine-endopeptidase (Penicillin-binding protein 4) n=1 Tax=Halomonas korlensis TaxID=463301 RepID=A0A1I7J6P8_9GAMM|nr:D-alanyl-D-alanine carboxypeptidase/D-alanyl-D-alanine-endopeptidase [Halomonas korlensis]SFU80814.1 D-alanyl-D-alanine carboxypeptidase / D-alanyl-D-alanine-endopeptidase (penicillin-binding protein 4) [Halomonas korlensis]